MSYRRRALSVPVLFLGLVVPSVAAQSAEMAPAVDKEPSPFFSSDGAFDVSGFLSTRAGFLPLAVPITEPAVGYGLALGLTFFHDRPQTLPRTNGEPPQVIMPSTTTVFGVGTEGGTLGAGVAHLGMWSEGRVRYTGAAGYVSLDLDWYGRSDLFNGRSIGYENDVAFLYQRIAFQVGDSPFFIGPQYRLFAADTTFDVSSLSLDVPDADLESRTAGLGISLGYNSLDHPFSPRRGLRAEATYSQQSEWFGGDFDYGRLDAYMIAYVPVGKRLVLGMRGDGQFSSSDAPFYDLPGLNIRGLPRGRFVDDVAVLGETELRYDFARRWTAVGFVGVGWVADSIDSLFDADARWAGGAGLRYLIAEDYGLRLGVDVAHGDGEFAFYIGIGTGWMRP